MKLKLKDVIIVSLLGVVGFVISMASGMITQLFGTYGVFVHVSIGSLLCAPVYFVMCHKIPKRGAIFIYYLLAGIIYSIMGFIPMLPIMVVAGLLGELCIGNRNNYINDSRISISYVVSQVIYALHGFFFILFLGVEGLVKTFPNLFTMEKAQMVKDTFFSPKNMAIILSVEIIAAILGTLFGKYVNKKFFDKTSKKKDILS
ncbi:MptD family putative ECF transporter S component [Pseudoramibacter alactolyticus]|jgi:putative ECF transporter S component (TIGR02185 family)|uniref:MptD family putative ECF transporter S component n=1 Tax=Pseudoramibacter alactolyticus TaxID=113287 RepID=UPI002354F5C5|nr:MptD family putative ECF transporter S component [Pseudoramibacter alactolyticus]MBM6968070.1 MptD family putative ECF transporter S component [Pseudoramibacter alactolyticus]